MPPPYWKLSKSVPESGGAHLGLPGYSCWYWCCQSGMYPPPPHCCCCCCAKPTASWKSPEVLGFWVAGGAGGGGGLAAWLAGGGGGTFTSFLARVSRLYLTINWPTSSWNDSKASSSISLAARPTILPKMALSELS